MERNRLGTSEVDVTAMGLGTAQLGDLLDSMDQEQATAVVDAAWNVGIRYFDTAPHYGLGAAERRLGMALADRVRDEFVLSSKVGRIIETASDGELTRRWDFSDSGIRRSIDESLVRLGVDRIDIVLIHDPAEHLDEALNIAYPTLQKLKDEGMVGAIGVGTGDLGALLAFARTTSIDTMMIAGRYTLLEQPAAAEVIPACVDAGISILNAGVFNSGLLANARPAAGARYEYAPAPIHLLERARRIADLATHNGTTLPQAALKFASRGAGVASVVVGADTPEQVYANASLLEETRDLGDLWSGLQLSHLVVA